MVEATIELTLHGLSEKEAAAIKMVIEVNLPHIRITRHQRRERKAYTPHRALEALEIQRRHGFSLNDSSKLFLIGLHSRAEDQLKKSGVKTIGHLTQMTSATISSLVGDRLCDHVEEVLGWYGLKLRQE